MPKNDNDTKLYSLMPLRDIVVFPHMVAPLVVGRRKSIQALEDAMEKRTEIFLVSQKESTIDEPTEDGIYTCGTLAVVMQLLRLPDGTIKALVEGKRRAEIVSFVPNENFFQVEVKEFPDEEEVTREMLAYERELRKYFSEFAAINKKIAKGGGNFFNIKTIKKKEPKIKVLEHELLASTLSYLMLAPW